MTYRILRACNSDGTSKNNYQWPIGDDAVGQVVVAPDWSDTPECGGGLHGWLWGHGDPTCTEYHRTPNCLWYVVETDMYVELDGKVKFRSGKIVYAGTNRDAAVNAVRIGAPDGVLPMWLKATAGDCGTATAGDCGTATAGDHGTAKAGERGTAKAGDYGTAKAGERGTATAGNYGMATAGFRGTATAGNRGMAMADDRGTATAGFRGTATAGDCGTATAGDCGTAMAGDRGTATAGDHGTAMAGDRGTATAGASGMVQLRWYDGSRYRVVTGYVGEDGIEANTAYRVVAGRLTKESK